MEVITFRSLNVADFTCFHDRFNRFLRDTMALILTFDKVYNQEVLIFKLTHLSYMGLERFNGTPYGLIIIFFSFSRHLLFTQI